MRNVQPTPLHAEIRQSRPAGFFVLRSPLLPFERFAGLGATPDVARERIGKILRTDGRVREAIRIASPALFSQLEVWLRNPRSEHGSRIEQSLVRYLARMAGRATPFGLFAGVSTGSIDTWSLAISTDMPLVRTTRLDHLYVASLCAALAQDPVVRSAIRWRANSSAYRVGDAFRYCEAEYRAQRTEYKLSSVPATPYLEAVLASAQCWVDLHAIKRALTSCDPTLSRDEIDEFVSELISAQLLEPELAPVITGQDCLSALLTQLRRGGAWAAVNALENVQQDLKRLDAAFPGTEMSVYEEVETTLKTLPAQVDVARLFQVDMARPIDDLSIDARLPSELLRAASALCRMGMVRGASPSLDRFAERFRARYEEREVPLLEVLDRDFGIGYDEPTAGTGEAAPLLETIPLLHRGEQAYRDEPGRVFWLRKLALALANGGCEIDLSERDLDLLEASLPDQRRVSLPESFCITAGIAGDPGNPSSLQFLVEGVFPGAGRMLARFCHAVPDLEPRVRALAEAEQALEPNATLCEIVHLPEGRLGNILSRPVLRGAELVYLGASSALPRDQILADDLLLSMRGTRFVLRSRSRNREIAVRLTNAHNYSRGLPLYRFLCDLQMQARFSTISFSWGSFESAPILPRVRVGRAIVSLARWNLDEPILERLRAASDPMWIVGELRRSLRLPRFVCLEDGDNELPIDLENPLSVTSFVALLAKRTVVRLVEMFGADAQRPLADRSGTYLAEFQIPFLRTKPSTLGMKAIASSIAQPLPRTFAPGSEWAYFKIYAGPTNADHILKAVVAPFARRALAEGIAHEWFFIRFADPDWHLRVRFRGDPEKMLALLVPRFLQELAAQVAPSTYWRVALDQYDREIERYGGPATIESCERIFAADSEAVIEILDRLEGEEGHAARWKLVTLGIDDLFGAFGLSLGERAAVVAEMRRALSTEFERPARLEVSLSQRFRSERADLEALLEDPRRTALSDAAAIFERRRRKISHSVQLIRECAPDALLAITGSLAHMHANRMLRFSARAHELVIYDFLERLYRARSARPPRDSPPLNVATSTPGERG